MVIIVSSLSRTFSVGLQLSLMFLPPAFLVRVEEPRARHVLVLVILLYASQGRALLDAAVCDELRCAAGLVAPRLPEVVRGRVVRGWIGAAFYHSGGCCGGGVRVVLR